MSRQQAGLAMWQTHNAPISCAFVAILLSRGMPRN